MKYLYIIILLFLVINCTKLDNPLNRLNPLDPKAIGIQTQTDL